MGAPAVSVIIPTYNRAAMVTEAVESVLAQQGVDFELLVVDDGSTDDTETRLASYGSCLTYLRQEHRGVSAARNRGLQASRAPYVAFLDSDDLWLPGKLAAQYQFFQRHSEAWVCQTEEIWYRRGRRVNPGRRHRKVSGDIFRRSLELCLVSPSAVMMRRELFDRVGLFDEELQAAEDYDLWLRVSVSHQVWLLPRPLVIKRGGHPDQLSAIPGIDRYRIKALVKIIESGSLSPVQHQWALEALERKCAIYGNGCRKRGRLQEADYYLGLPERYRARHQRPGTRPGSSPSS